MIVSIVDYGSGNLRSAAKAFERAISEAGYKMSVSITSDPKRVADSDRIILPGVGAFADCMRGLEAIPGMPEVLSKVVCDMGRPFFGICVGMQLMAKLGKENGNNSGLGWLDAEVNALAPSDQKLKIPHMGWNQLIFSRPRHPVLANLQPKDHVYFLHSYHILCRRQTDVLAHTMYGGKIVAAVGIDNIFGTQFHPEKSQKVGLQIIMNFLSWCP